MLPFQFELMTARHKWLRCEYLLAGKAVFPTAGTPGGYTGSLNLSVTEKVPDMAQPGGRGSEGMEIRATEHKWVIKGVTRVR